MVVKKEPHLCFGLFGTDVVKTSGPSLGERRWAPDKSAKIKIRLMEKSCTTLEYRNCQDLVIIIAKNNRNLQYLVIIISKNAKNSQHFFDMMITKYCKFILFFEMITKSQQFLSPPLVTRKTKGGYPLWLFKFVLRGRGDHEQNSIGIRQDFHHHDQNPQGLLRFSIIMANIPNGFLRIPTVMVRILRNF